MKNNSEMRLVTLLHRNKYSRVIVSAKLGLSHPLHNPLRGTNERNVGVPG